MGLLDLNNVCMFFGGIKAINEFEMSLTPGELVGLIGPNGAGKTTVFNVITGVYKPTSGSVTFDGKRIDGRKPFVITQSGIARTFQNIRLFGNLSVLDNVKIAYHFHSRHGVMSSIAHGPSHFQGEGEITKKARELLEIFSLTNRQDELAKNLPYGEQRRLEIARALAARPRLLLLDEPAAGMNAKESQDLVRLIDWIHREFDLTILLIEHHMDVVMSICKRIYVLDYGRTIAEGTPEEIGKNPRVIEAYLGEEVAQC
jgi:branched-chain amino acid transport system ATP-binding protein